MRKSKRNVMSDRSAGAAKDAVPLVPPSSVPAVIAGRSMLGPIWQPPERIERRPALPPARAKADAPRPVWQAPELPTPPPRVSPARAESNARVWAPPDPALPRARARALVCVDRTASRQQTFEPAKRLTDALLGALPGELEMSLASFGGEKVTFSPWTTNAARIREVANGLRCQAGYTQLLDVLRSVLEIDAVRCVVHIGDMFEESPEAAAGIAAELAGRGIRVIVLHDTCLRGVNFSAEAHDDARAVFQMLAQRTGGALLPFDITALEELAKLLEAVAVLAVGGTEMLTQKAPTMPAARLLLPHLGSSKALTIRRA